jgi:hypothetical protein
MLIIIWVFLLCLTPLSTANTFSVLNYTTIIEQLIGKYAEGISFIEDLKKATKRIQDAVDPGTFHARGRVPNHLIRTLYLALLPGVQEM